MWRIQIYTTCLVKGLSMWVISIKNHLKLFEFSELQKRQMKNSFLEAVIQPNMKLLWKIKAKQKTQITINHHIMRLTTMGKNLLTWLTEYKRNMSRHSPYLHWCRSLRFMCFKSPDCHLKQTHQGVYSLAPINFSFQNRLPSMKIIISYFDSLLKFQKLFPQDHSPYDLIPLIGQFYIAFLLEHMTMPWAAHWPWVNKNSTIGPSSRQFLAHQASLLLLSLIRVVSLPNKMLLFHLELPSINQAIRLWSWKSYVNGNLIRQIPRWLERQF